MGTRAGGSASPGIDWGFIYGHLATVCGYTPSQIDAMTLPQVDELFGYWAKHPPVHLLVAAYLGWEAPKTLEQQWAEGAMGPADFLDHYRRTGGKLQG